MRETKCCLLLCRFCILILFFPGCYSGGKSSLNTLIPFSYSRLENSTSCITWTLVRASCGVLYADETLSPNSLESFFFAADVGVQVLDFNYMKGHVAHAGFPEVSYGIMAERLVKAGYKVARVEQTETPEMLKERKKKKNRPGPTPKW